jgi:transposase
VAVDRALLEGWLTEGVSVEGIARRLDKHPSTVSYWMGKYGLEAPNRARYAPKGGIAEVQLAALVEDGLSIGQIAAKVGRSKGTVRHWMKRYGLQTQQAAPRRPPGPMRSARDGGLVVTVMACRRHGESEFVLEGRGYYRCKRCRAEGVTRHRRKLKEILVGEAGGRCIVCGYDRSARALEFHHLDPAEKRLQLSAQGATLGLDVLREEARKCVLLCSNCHAEVEDGALVLPLEFTSALRRPIKSRAGPA